VANAKELLQVTIGLFFFRLNRDRQAALDFHRRPLLLLLLV
jgi:hypothetical protein